MPCDSHRGAFLRLWNVTTIQPRLRDGDVPPSPLAIDPSALYGRWRNTETRWQWVSELEITPGPRLRVRGGASQNDWGEVPIDTVYTTGPDSAEIGGFAASFEIEGYTSMIQATMNMGLMVIVAFNDTHDDAQPSRVTREFFARGGAQ